jgi:hypothetical protein
MAGKQQGQDFVAQILVGQAELLEVAQRGGLHRALA